MVRQPSMLRHSPAMADPTPPHRPDDVTYGDVASVTGGRLADIRAEDRARARRGAQILADALVAEGVDCLFGYPGGANLEIFDVLDAAGIRCYRTEHEQGAVHAAQGYARASGRVGDSPGSQVAAIAGASLVTRRARDRPEESVSAAEP